MLLKQDTLKRIEEGSVTLAFRKWRRPTVKAGGTLLTSIGQLAIEAVDPVDPPDITPAEATAAGFADLPSLIRRLDETKDGDVYRVRLSLRGPDPRIALRREIPVGRELDALLKRLQGFDARSREGPWTAAVLTLVAQRPAERAGDLAPYVRMETPRFKANVRKLKGLGLTESLEVGYRLSPRGRSALEALSRATGGADEPD